MALASDFGKDGTERGLPWQDQKRTDRVDCNAVTIAAIADLWPQARDCLHSSANDAVAHYILYGLRV